MMIINHAILHSFDFESGSTHFSDQELDRENKQVKSYVQRTCRKCLGSAENKHGEFADGSGFAEELTAYRRGELGFVELSVQIAQWFWEELRRGEDLANADLLVADVQESAEAPKAGADDEEAATAYDAEPERTFAIVLLPRRQSFIHELAGFEGHSINGIVRTDAILPSPAQKIDTYALVNLGDFRIAFHDKPRPIAGEDTLIVPDGLLQCTAQASSKEAVQAVTRIVEDVAEEYGANTADYVSRAKAALARDVQMAEQFEPEEIGKEIFEDAPEMRQRYEERYQETAREESLPDEVPMRRGQANSMAKKHKIRTDTGIDITFPSEYGHDSNYIAFSTDPDGHIQIVIKNVAKIENR